MPGQGLEEIADKKLIKNGEMVEKLYRITVKDIHGTSYDIIINQEEAIDLVDSINEFEYPKE